MIFMANNWFSGLMDTKNNNKTSERRANERRKDDDRRVTVRFGDVLGRRSGVDRRVGQR